MNVTTITREQECAIPPVASIVHDLRNPLSTIHGSAEMLISSRLSELQLYRIARNMYRASVRMRELLDEFLTQYGNRGTAAQPWNLRELVTSAVDRIALLAEAQSVEVVQSVAKNLVVTMDRPRIQRVLINLLVNALDVMPNGGTIRITATPMRDFVAIKVRDTGPGISPEIRERLFQPFATSGKAGGLGLGLALSLQAVRDHGGQMWATSSEQGACFTVRLPTIPRHNHKLIQLPQKLA